MSKEREKKKEQVKKIPSCTIVAYFFVDSVGSYHHQEILLKNGQAALLYRDREKGAQLQVWKDINELDKLSVSENDPLILKIINTQRGELNILDWAGYIQSSRPNLSSALEERGRWYTYLPRTKQHHFFVGFGRNPHEAREALENAFQRATSVKPNAFPRTALEHTLSY